MTDELSRIARLETKLDDHLDISGAQLKEINDKLDRNESTHANIITMVQENAAEMTAMIREIGSQLDRYNWLARGVMIALFGLGMIGGWIAEGWHFLRTLLGKL